MTFNKPCRICNRAVPAMPQRLPPASATFKELKGSYELRIRIRGAHAPSYIIVITEGILYVYEESGATSGDDGLLCSFTLPANVLQNQVRAFRCNYGLKVVMPKARPNGIIVQVPLIDDND